HARVHDAWRRRELRPELEERGAPLVRVEDVGRAVAPLALDGRDLRGPKGRVRRELDLAGEEVGQRGVCVADEQDLDPLDLRLAAHMLVEGGGLDEAAWL